MDYKIKNQPGKPAITRINSGDTVKLTPKESDSRGRKKPKIKPVITEDKLKIKEDDKK